MSEESARGISVSVSLGEALNEYLASLKPEQRRRQEGYVRRYVEYAGEGIVADTLTGSRVESYAEAQIRPSDPAAPDRVAALKAWFLFLKKRGYTTQNFGIHIRVRRMAGRGPGSNQVRIEEAPVEMTADGLAQLQRELAEISGNTPDLVKAISVAREDKDFRENAPLDAAREALAFNDQRRKRLEATLKRAVVVERSRDDLSAVGSLVTVTRLDTMKSATYQLVGAREANAAEAKISVESPVGRELLGKRIGDEVSVKAPSGEIQYRIDGVVHT